MFPKCIFLPVAKCRTTTRTLWSEIRISVPKTLPWRGKWWVLHSSCSSDREPPAVYPSAVFKKAAHKTCTIFVAEKFMFSQLLWDFDLYQVIFKQAINDYAKFRWKTDILQLILFLNAHVFRVYEKIFNPLKATPVKSWKPAAITFKII